MALHTEIVIGVKRLRPDAKLPTYAHIGHFGDLAADIYCAEDVVIPPGQNIPVATGIALEFPEGYGAIVEDRSGLALRGLTTLAGVVDPGYRGELRIVFSNLSNVAINLSKGDRVAQLRLVRLLQARFIEVDELSSTTRDTKGFGSTGQ